jgi:hypothetical protein
VPPVYVCVCVLLSWSFVQLCLCIDGVCSVVGSVRRVDALCPRQGQAAGGQVQVQVCFTSVCGQVQPLDVAARACSSRLS